jgi:nucleoside-diphosphate-sugar epimerase
MSRIFFFGYGYTASHVAQLLRPEGWEMAGTTRTQDKVKRMWAQGVEPHIWSADQGTLEAPLRVFNNVTHILHGMQPNQNGDAVLKTHFKVFQKIAPNLKWYGYISSTSVYGDTHGEYATEDFAPNPTTARGKLRLRVERRHQQLYKKANLPLHIFRVGAIYGPARGAIRRVSAGDASLVHKEGHLTSRIHVEDLAQILKASMDNPNPGSIYNCVDDLPTGQEVPLDFAYDLLGKPKPAVVDFEDVKDQLPPARNKFYEESRRVSNAKVKSELGVKFKYPTYKEGYEALNDRFRQKLDAD